MREGITLGGHRANFEFDRCASAARSRGKKIRVKLDSSGKEEQAETIASTRAYREGGKSQVGLQRLLDRCRCR